MSKWLETKEFGQITVDKGINTYRVKKEDGYFYLARSKYDLEAKKTISRDHGFELEPEQAEKFFNDEITEHIHKQRRGRKSVRQNRRAWAKFMKNMPKVTGKLAPEDTRTEDDVILEAREAMRKALAEEGLTQEDVLPGVSDEVINQAIKELKEEQGE